MKISEKQILQLFDIARMCGHILISVDADFYSSKIKQISELLENIRNQQSDKLLERRGEE